MIKVGRFFSFSRLLIHYIYIYIVFPNDNLTITLPPGMCLFILMKNDNDGYVGVFGNTESPLSSVFSVNFACY